MTKLIFTPVSILWLYVDFFAAQAHENLCSMSQNMF